MVSTSLTDPNGSAPRKPVAQIRYELLTLGDELLLGLTANGHLTFIGAQLGRRGVPAAEAAHAGEGLRGRAAGYEGEGDK